MSYWRRNCNISQLYISILIYKKLFLEMRSIWRIFFQEGLRNLEESRESVGGVYRLKILFPLCTEHIHYIIYSFLYFFYLNIINFLFSTIICCITIFFTTCVYFIISKMLYTLIISIRVTYHTFLNFCSQLIFTLYFTLKKFFIIILRK